MAEKSLETLIKERAAQDRLIAARQLKNAQAALDRLSASDVGALAAEIKAMIPGLNPTGQERLSQFVTVVEGVPGLIADQIAILTAASTEPPVAPPLPDAPPPAV